MRNYPFYIAIVFVLSVVLIVVFILPQYKDFNSLKKEIIEKEARLQSQEDYLKELQQTLKEVEKRKEDFEKLESALPDELLLTDFLNFLQKTTSQTGLILKDISSATISGEEKGVKTARINFELEGNYSSFKNFLLVIEKSARLVEVESISFESPKEEETFHFKIAIVIHSY